MLSMWCIYIDYGRSYSVYIGRVATTDERRPAHDLATLRSSVAAAIFFVYSFLFAFFGIFHTHSMRLYRRVSTSSPPPLCCIENISNSIVSRNDEAMTNKIQFSEHGTIRTFERERARPMYVRTRVCVCASVFLAIE